MDYIDLKTEKGNFRVINLPNIETISQFGDDVYYKFANDIHEKIIPRPAENCYLKLIGNLNQLKHEIVFNNIASFKFPILSTIDFLDSLLNPFDITIKKELQENQQIKFIFFENPYIFKIRKP